MTKHQSKIEKLITEKCPKGVEFKELWEITVWDKRFNGVPKEKQKRILSFKHVLAKTLKELEVENGDIKLLATGKFEGHTSEELAKNYLNKGEVISIPSGGTANIKYYKGKFVDGGNILASTIDNNLMDLKFCYYFLLTKQSLLDSYFRGSSVKHPEMSKILKIKIPVPNIEVQHEIVRILNNFTKLETELEAELEARKKQYEYYRSELLTFNERERDIRNMPG